MRVASPRPRLLLGLLEAACMIAHSQPRAQHSAPASAATATGSGFFSGDVLQGYDLESRLTWQMVGEDEGTPGAFLGGRNQVACTANPVFWKERLVDRIAASIRGLLSFGARSFGEGFDARRAAVDHLCVLLASPSVVLREVAAEGVKALSGSPDGESSCAFFYLGLTQKNGSESPKVFHRLAAGDVTGWLRSLLRSELDGSAKLGMSAALHDVLRVLSGFPPSSILGDPAVHAAMFFAALAAVSDPEPAVECSREALRFLEAHIGVDLLRMLVRSRCLPELLRGRVGSTDVDLKSPSLPCDCRRILTPCSWMALPPRA